MTKRVIVIVGIAGALGTAPGGAADAVAAKPPPKAPGLRAFASCGSLVRYARRHAVRTVGSELIGPVRRRVPLPLTDAPAGRVEAPASAPGKAFSGTNVQEAGVDEPDIVKTDGSRIFAVAGGRLHAVDVSGAVPTRVGTLTLPDASGHELLLRGDRLLVASSTQIGTVLSEVDVSVPATMKVVRTLTVDGQFLSARLTGGTARVGSPHRPPRSSFPIPRDRTSSRCGGRRGTTERPSAAPGSGAGCPHTCCGTGAPGTRSRGVSSGVGRCGGRASSRASTCSRCSRSTSTRGCLQSTRTP